jgi:hypothetical protein
MQPAFSDIVIHRFKGLSGFGIEIVRNEELDFDPQGK